MMTIASAIASKIKTDPRDRERLLAFVLKKPREWIIAHPEVPVRPAMAARHRRLLRHLEYGEPLPHLLGEQWFYGRPFTVNRHVLIPRPETELLVELAMAHIKKYGVRSTEYGVLDIGTGSGCIAITLAAELPNTCIIATDASPDALRVARVNARRYGVTNRIAFIRGNLLEPLIEHGDYPRGRTPIPNDSPSPSRSPSRWEGEKRKKVPQFCILPSAFCVVANLPYLTTAEWRALPRSLRAYEPRQALDGGPDGLRYFRLLFGQLQELSPLHSPLFTLLEVDPRRKRALATLIRKTLPGRRASWHRDLSGRYRVLCIEYSGY